MRELFASRRRLHASRSAALQMVDEKARVVLKKSEFSTLTYYLDEYSARQMTIEAFVAVLLELLNTPDKVSNMLPACIPSVSLHIALSSHV